MSKVEAFLSHKAKDGILAKQIQEALGPVLPSVNIFLSEEIGKSKDFRKEIWTTLAKAKFFILLYTDPNEDWSWCFFEAGAFHSDKTARQRHIYCLHTKDLQPPSPLANLQTIRAEAADIKLWIEDIGKRLKGRAPPKSRVDEAAKRIENAVKARSVLVERMVKPHICITPRWPDQTQSNFNKAKLPTIPMENAIVNIDPESANKLGFTSLPDELELMQLLQMLDCDSSQWASGRPYWVDRFFTSLNSAIHGNLNLQEAAYFRHVHGNILRPVVVSVAKSRDGTCCRLKVLFVHAFSAPLTNHPTTVQRLADGIRLGVRTRIEIINGFSGRLSRMHQEGIKGAASTDMLPRKYSVGRRVVEALQVITEEARAHGVRADEPIPVLFSDPVEQDQYEYLRNEAVRVWDEIKDAAEEEDKLGAGAYLRTEGLLLDLKQLNDQYLKLALPRLNRLLGSINDSERNRRTRLEDRRSENWRCDRPNS